MPSALRRNIFHPCEGVGDAGLADIDAELEQFAMEFSALPTTD